MLTSFTVYNKTTTFSPGWAHSFDRFFGFFLLFFSTVSRLYPNSMISPSIVSSAVRCFFLTISLKQLVQALIFCFYPNYLLQYSSSFLASHTLMSPSSLYSPLQLRNICLAFESHPTLSFPHLESITPLIMTFKLLPPISELCSAYLFKLHLFPTTLAAIPALTADSLFLCQINNGLFLATLF